MTTKLIYIAGDMLNKGAQLQRAAEKADITSLGLKVYNPQDNKEINDKQQVSNDRLAERIVKADTDALMASNVVVIEPLPQALGTTVELGQLLGYKQLAELVLTIINDDKLDVEERETFVRMLCENQINRKVLPHIEDVRFGKNLEEEEWQRSSYGVNAYVLGACIELSGTEHGMYTWPEILEKLKNESTK